MCKGKRVGEAVPSAQRRHVRIPTGELSSRAEPGCCFQPLLHSSGANPQLGPSLFSRLFWKGTVDADKCSGAEPGAASRGGSQHRPRRQNPKSFLSFALSILKQQSQGRCCWHGKAVVVWSEGIAAVAPNAHCHAAVTMATPLEEQSSEMCKAISADAKWNDCHPHSEQNNPASATALRTASCLFC